MSNISKLKLAFSLWLIPIIILFIAMISTMKRGDIMADTKQHLTIKSIKGHVLPRATLIGIKSKKE